jgi:hypothetical protein
VAFRGQQGPASRGSCPIHTWAEERPDARCLGGKKWGSKLSGLAFSAYCLMETRGKKRFDQKATGNEYSILHLAKTGGMVKREA